MKRRVVDASLLGDALPLGWKVIIALRRKGGRFSPYCRRYISPSGEQFSSCKEVSTYLKSYFGIKDTEHLRDSRAESQQLQIVKFDKSQCINSKDSSPLKDISNSSISNRSLAVQLVKDVSVSGIDDLPDVQVRDLYECHTCNVSFDVKGDYLQHLMSTHKTTTKRYMLGSSAGSEVFIRDVNYECNICQLSFDEEDKYLQHNLSTHKKGSKKRKLGGSVGDGVIMRDGKYECQFCHKIFEERRRYLGHVGNHVKGSISTPKKLLRSRSSDRDQPKARTRNSKMDDLIVIAHNSVQNALPSVLEKEPSCVDNVNQLSRAEVNITQNTGCDIEKYSNSCVDEPRAENGGWEGKDLSSVLYPCNKVHRAASACLTETETGREERDQDINEVNEISMTDQDISEVNEISMTNQDINGAIPCLDELEMEKVSSEANISLKELSSCDGVGRESVADDMNTSSHCPSDLEMKKDGRENSASLCSNKVGQMSVIDMTDRPAKDQAFTSILMDIEKNCGLNKMMMEGGETNISADNSAGNWEGKSTTTEDEGSADESEGGYDVHFLSFNQKSPDMVAAGDVVQSNYMDIQEPKHAQNDYDNNLAVVAGDSDPFGCTAPQESLNSSLPFDEIFDKAGQNICTLDPSLESGNAFEYMKLDAIEPQMYMYNAMDEGDPMFLPEVSVDLERSTGFDLGFDASAKAEPEFPSGKAYRSMTTMLCVWCGLEFSHEEVEIEPQPDSVGFMCPACRAKISKQLNDLDSNFS